MKPALTLSYALAFIVLMRAACAGRRSWLSMMTLAALFGFLGLTSSTLTPIVFVLWVGLEAIWFMQSRRAGTAPRSDLIRPASGLALAVLLLLAGGWLTSTLDDSSTSGLKIGWNQYLGRWRLLGALDRLPGGVGSLGLGPLAVAGAAVLLARRDRLVLALAVGTGLLLLTALPVIYEPTHGDVGRFEGHARNLALLALLLALGVRLASLRPVRWRYAAGATVLALITWPTVAEPVRNLGLALSDGVELSNAQPAQQVSDKRVKERYALESLPSNRIAAYIHNNTSVDARVFSPYPNQMTYATGRPNASGFAGLVHLNYANGPEYLDALDYFEPGAIGRLGFEYVHAPDAWVEGLPDEALRRAIPASATVYLPRGFATRSGVRAASALSHARVHGATSLANLALRTPWPIKSLDGHVPDLVIMSPQFVPWMFPPASRQPIWWNDETAVFALDRAVDTIMPPPRAGPFPFSVRVSEERVADGRIAFTATFDDRAPKRWTGQDWIVIALDDSPWGIPKHFLPDGYTPARAAWFPGQIGPGWGQTFRRYEFDFGGGNLAVRGEDGALTPVESSERTLGSGGYVLAVRLRHNYQPRLWRDAAVIPVLKITVSKTGEVSYQVHEDAGGVKPVR